VQPFTIGETRGSLCRRAKLLHPVSTLLLGPALPQLPEPTHAERVRTLMSLTSVATLSTISRKHAGYPFGSLMPFALDSLGRAHLPHQQYGDAHPEPEGPTPDASLFVGQAGADRDALGAAPSSRGLAMPNLCLRTM